MNASFEDNSWSMIAILNLGLLTILDGWGQNEKREIKNQEEMKFEQIKNVRICAVEKEEEKLLLKFCFFSSFKTKFKKIV